MKLSSILNTIIARLAFRLFKITLVEFYVIKPYEEVEELKEQLQQQYKEQEKKLKGYYADINRSQLRRIQNLETRVESLKDKLNKRKKQTSLESFFNRIG
jgi:phage shock protein A